MCQFIDGNVNVTDNLTIFFFAQNYRGFCGAIVLEVVTCLIFWAQRPWKRRAQITSNPQHRNMYLGTVRFEGAVAMTLREVAGARPTHRDAHVATPQRARVYKQSWVFLVDVSEPQVWLCEVLLLRCEAAQFPSHSIPF